MRLMAEVFIPRLLVGCLVAAAAVPGAQECEGPYKDRALTPEELATVLRNHQEWLKARGEPNDERRANLCRADLNSANLQKANLQQADLSAANLQEAYLFAVNLEEAILRPANLQRAVYDPHPGKLPNFWTLTDPHNHLDKLVFHESPAGLIALREAVKRAGMRTQR